MCFGVVFISVCWLCCVVVVVLFELSKWCWSVVQSCQVDRGVMLLGVLYCGGLIGSQLRWFLDSPALCAVM